MLSDAKPDGCKVNSPASENGIYFVLKDSKEIEFYEMAKTVESHFGDSIPERCQNTWDLNHAQYDKMKWRLDFWRLHEMKKYFLCNFYSGIPLKQYGQIWGTLPKCGI